MRRSNGPTAKVLSFAAQQPGHVISWSEARVAYSCGTVKSYDGYRQAADRHRFSISNVLRRYFDRVEGARGLYVLRSSIENLDENDDAHAMQSFHNLYGCDEFGMSVHGDTSQGHGTNRFTRMSGI